MPERSTEAPASGFVVRPIGLLHTPFRRIEDCPRNTRQLDPAPICRARVFPEYVVGLQDVEGFSHLILLYWLDRAHAPTLVFRPPFDASERGLFATRSPARPNPISLAVVAFEGFESPGVLKVRYLDCLNGTPLLDIKPYLPSTDAEPGASMGWLAGR